MWSKESIIMAQFSKYKLTISQNRRSFSMLSMLKRLSILSGGRAPDGPDLPSPLLRKFQLSVQFTPCLMMGGFIRPRPFRANCEEARLYVKETKRTSS